jgi:hypothetical protein
MSATEPNWLMLFKEKIAVYFENHTEHINNIGKHYVSATKTNRLMMWRETAAVYCENRAEHTNALCGQNREFV